MVEEAGIPTISMGNAADRMAHIKPPRALLVKFARGSMFGEPGNVKRQRRVILDALEALKEKDRAKYVKQALEALPETDAFILTLFYYEELSHRPPDFTGGELRARRLRMDW